MWPLPELQGRLADAISSGRLEQALTAIADGAPGPAARLRIYRNHFRVTLAEALAANYPACERLLGEACFGALARRFIASHPPATPCLFEYGLGFPLFIGRQPELRTLPYAADLARLEWAMLAAGNAPDRPALGPADLARLSPEALPDLRLTLHPAWRLVVSRWPLLAIWAVCRPGAGHEELSLEREPTRLLIGRDGDGDVVRLALWPGQTLFLRRLGRGHGLGAALTVAALHDYRFDAAATLALCLEGGVLAAGPDPATLC